MRIISGKFKGRYIKTKKNSRPTQTKVRKALFDILQDRVIDSRFLELFAGTGSIGIEAISCGAKEVVFVEKDLECMKILKENLSKLQITNYKLLNLDALKSIDILSKERERFDIIFLDPPYYKGLAKKSLKKIFNCDIFSKKGIIIVQHYTKDILPKRIEDLILFKRKRYGDTILSFYKNEGNIPRNF